MCITSTNQEPNGAKNVRNVAAKMFYILKQFIKN